MTPRPTVMVLGYHHVHALQVIAELSVDLGAEIVSVATKKTHPVIRSRYTDQRVIINPDGSEEHQLALSRTIKAEEPDVVIPIGYESVLNLNAIRDDIRSHTRLRLPPTESLRVSLDKSKTVDVARSVGIDVPNDFGKLNRGEPGEIRSRAKELEYPVFLKAVRESGRNVLSRVNSTAEFVSVSKELLDDEYLEGDEILIQEYVPGDGNTYGCGFLFKDGEPALSFAQRELRSIPREGGTGTRVAIHHDPELEQQSVRLLQELDWNGFALVEFRRRENGSYTLMEVNPKIWASYPLASRCGYRFATEFVSDQLDIQGRSSVPRKHDGEMIFPLRELYYTLKNWEDESLLDTVGAMLNPPAPIDIHIRDARAWIFPAGVLTSFRWAIRLWWRDEEPFE